MNESFGKSLVGKGIGYISLGILATIPFLLYKKYLYMGVSSKSLTFFIVVELIALLIGILFLIAREKNEKYSIYLSPVYIAIIVFFCVYVTVSFLGVDPHVSFWSKATRMTGIFFFIHVIFFSWIISSLINIKEWFNRFIATIFFTGLVFSIFSNFGPDGFNILWFNKTPQADGFMIGNSTFAGTFLLMTFFIGLWWVWGIEGMKRLWWQKILPFIGLINPMFLNFKVLTGTVSFSEIITNPLVVIGEARAGALSVFTGVIIWIVYLGITRIKENSFRRIVSISSIGIGFIIFCIAVISFITPDGFLREKYESLSGGARPLVWAIAGNAIAEKPILGWGPDNFDRAFIQNFDNKLFLPEYGGEVWFDRAHNIFIDTLVDVGAVGLIAYLALYISAGYMLIRIGFSQIETYRNFAVISGLFLVFHLLELQTAFDTVVSYIILGVIFACIHTVYRWNGYGKTMSLPAWGVPLIGVVCVVGAVFAYTETHTMIVSNRTHGNIRAIGSSKERVKLYEKLFASNVDKPTSLWRTATDLERGILEKPEILSNPEKVEDLLVEFTYIGSEYDAYLAKNPDDFRALLNRADILLFVRLLNEDRLLDSKKYIDRAQILVPQHPIPYIMNSVIAVYQNDFKNAYMYIEQAKKVNPDIEYTKQTEWWIKKQEKTFPEIDFRFIEKI